MKKIVHTQSRYERCSIFPVYHEYHCLLYTLICDSTHKYPPPVYYSPSIIVYFLHWLP